LNSSDIQKFLTFAKTPIAFTKGVGPILGKKLKSLNIHTFWDALCWMPRSYTVYEWWDFKAPAERKAVAVQVVSVCALHKSWKMVCHILHPSEANADTTLEVVFFKKPFFQRGERLILCGAFTSLQRMMHPEEVLSFPSSQLLPPLIFPQYPLTKGLTHKKISSIISQILQKFPLFEEWLPTAFMQKHSFLSWEKMFKMIHFPQNSQQIHEQINVRKRIAFELLVAQKICLLEEREKSQMQKSSSFLPQPQLIESFLKRFGYPLTSAQELVFHEIQQDLSKEQPMLRLVHGDVGSGKTLLAFLAALPVVEQGYQVAFLAPTEILARQHFQGLCRLTDLTVGLFVKGPKKELPLLSEGKIQVAVGTHALLQDNVTFKNLALVIIDEQQRFGVEQRLAILHKGICPHLLMLSATPIPRTFEMMLLGHVSVSKVTARPFESQVKTYTICQDKLPDIIQFLQQNLSEHQRAYWICPLIGVEEEEVADENQSLPEETATASVLQRFQALKEVFPEKTGILHGKMSSQEKNKALEDFRSGKVWILVSTTVVEVGVHVNEANIMVIEQSPCFGLAQLHQLRGRIGRNGQIGQCFLLYGLPLSKTAQKRLQILKNCNDGFKVAEKDWGLRGAGDLYGAQQSGIQEESLLYASLPGELIEKAHALALVIFQKRLIVMKLLLPLMGPKIPEALDSG
jgi:ATP-dependent DNA helicase RecG